MGHGHKSAAEAWIHLCEVLHVLCAHPIRGTMSLSYTT